jgi:hypothetical protein
MRLPGTAVGDGRPLSAVTNPPQWQSLELQNIVWAAIGVLANGLIEDPQEGTFLDGSKDED